VSKQNVELHRRTYRALNARDADALLALCDPQIEFQPLFAVVGDTVYHGHDGVRRWFETPEDAWAEDLRSEPDAFFDLGEYTLMFHTLRGRGKKSGAEVAMPAATVVKWRDGLIVSFMSYERRESALRDLGVSEDALEPIAP
jgi:ketosteroid isomerase-like protein